MLKPYDLLQNFNEDYLVDSQWIEGLELLMFWVVSHNPQPQHPKTQKPQALWTKR